MKKLDKKTVLSNPRYISAYCGRLLVHKCSHKCKTGFRKRHLVFIEISDDKI